MIPVQWTNAAFAQLKALPQELAYDIIRLVDFLINFPEMGAPLDSRFSRLNGYRQIVVKRNYRVVYEFDKAEQTAFILAVQHCRRKLPPTKELKRRKSQTE